MNVLGSYLYTDICSLSSLTVRPMWRVPNLADSASLRRCSGPICQGVYCEKRPRSRNRGRTSFPYRTGSRSRARPIRIEADARQGHINLHWPLSAQALDVELEGLAVLRYVIGAVAEDLSVGLGLTLVDASVGPKDIMFQGPERLWPLRGGEVGGGGGVGAGEAKCREATWRAPVREAVPAGRGLAHSTRTRRTT